MTRIPWPNARLQFHGTNRTVEIVESGDTGGYAFKNSLLLGLLANIVQLVVNGRKKSVRVRRTAHLVNIPEHGCW
jgi:hypothetical protein